MSSSVFDRRRSERFAELLDERHRRRHRRRSRIRTEMDRMEQLTDRLSTLSTAPEPTEEFRTGLRAMLTATIVRDGVGPSHEDKAEPKTSPAPGQRYRALAHGDRTIRALPTATPGRTRAAVLVGVTAGALALSGVSAASSDSVPGDTLYHVKRSSERAQLALAGSDQGRGQLYLELAHSRVREAGHVDPRLLRDVFVDMDAETVSGVILLTTAAVQRHDATILASIAVFAAEQRSRLIALAGVAEAEPMRQSLALLDAVDLRAKALAQALSAGCAIPTVDWLGPDPAAC